MRKCNLIIDSTCDLPQQHIDAEGVTLIRVPYTIEGVAYEDDMFTEQTPHDFYEKMRQGKSPSTSQPSVQSLQKAYDAAMKDGLPCVYLTFTSALSGTFETAALIANQFQEENEDAEIYVVDSKLPSIAEGLFVVEAINQMNAGLSAEEMVEWAQEARYFVDALFMVEDLETLKKGGRIPSSAAVAGAKLDVKPLLTLDADGGLKIAGIARGRKKGMRQLAAYFEKRGTSNLSGQCVVIGDADCKKENDKLRDLLVKQNESLITVQSNIGPVIGSHVGPGMLAVCFWGDDRRQNMTISDRIAKKVKAGKE